jgi:hypothetical protein
MSRKASKFTQAIRKICEEHNFNITYADARPVLSKMGFKLAKEPEDKSENYKSFEDKRKGSFPKKEEEVVEYYKKFAKAAGLSNLELDSIMKEDAVHRAFCNERNVFDVTKHNWYRTVNSMNLSSVVVKKKHQTLKSKEALEIMKLLLESGGSDAIKAKIKSLNVEIDRLSSILKKAVRVRKLLPDAA